MDGKFTEEQRIMYLEHKLNQILEHKLNQISFSNNEFKIDAISSDLTFKQLKKQVLELIKELHQNKKPDYIG